MPEEKSLANRFNLVKKIGEGGFGSTFLAYENKTQKKYVAKSISLNSPETQSKLPALRQEARVLSNLSHPQIPGFHSFIHS